MDAVQTRECPQCQREVDVEERNCRQCGYLLRRVRPTAVFGAADNIAPSTYQTPSLVVRDKRVLGLEPRWFYLAIGLLTAPILTFTPLLQRMGWFLTSLFHETGHVVVAWFFGHPAVPAIRLDGHAAAVHGEQQFFLCILVLGSLGYLVYQFRQHKKLRVVFGAIALLYPLFAFTGAKEVLHLVGGHVGELTIAAVFFTRAISGGFTHSSAERGLYATVAWYLYGKNLYLCAGLAGSEEMRAWYRSSGSFGLKNDYIRLGDLMGWSLSNVGALMLLVSLTALPIAYKVTVTGCNSRNSCHG